MISVYQLIAEMEEKEWNYYAGYSRYEIQKPFISEITSKEFIALYFKQGGKEFITERFNMYSFGEHRADHTVSIFFLGLALFHQTTIEGKQLFNGIISDKYEFFHFIWFVTCLAHDIAFDLERDTELIASCTDLFTLKQYLAISNDLSQCNVELVPHYLFGACEAYFKYRYDVRHAVDHGIYAGFLMYDALVENRRRKHELKDDESLSWEPWLEPQYAYAAATVAIHNIWFPAQKDIPLYEEHGLDVLIGKEKISFAEAPLLYILAIVDTLDPVKAFQREIPDVTDILKNTFLTFPSKNTIVLQISNELELVLQFKDLQKKVKGLEDWLDVSVLAKDREIYIHINT